MRVPRVYVPGRQPPRGILDLPPEESLHVARVLRRSAGDRVMLVAEGGGLHEAEIVRVDAERREPVVTVRVTGEAPAAPAILGSWTLAVAVVKADAFELSIRMACELGVGRLAPLITARTVVRPGTAGGKVARWARVAREASKQCGRGSPLEIPEPRGISEFLATWRKEVPPAARGAEEVRWGWVLEPGAPFSPELAAWACQEGIPPAVFLVGPEGGLTPEESRQARTAGLQPLGFPTPVLRTPTAVALVAAVGVALQLPLGTMPGGPRNVVDVGGLSG